MVLEKAPGVSEAQAQEALIMAKIEFGLSEIILRRFKFSGKRFRCKSEYIGGASIIAYVLVVELQYSMGRVAEWMGCDRSTISQYLTKVEEKRDNIEYDEYIDHLVKKYFRRKQENKND